VLEELEQLVEADDSQSRKIIFAEHRGCGKSTLLAEFGRQCQKRGYFVVFFSIIVASKRYEKLIPFLQKRATDECRVLSAKPAGQLELCHCFASQTDLSNQNGEVYLASVGLKFPLALLYEDVELIVD
jgi:hypothetical protein